jgi:hypothetical protein
MKPDTMLDDKAMIEKVLARMKDRKPGISAKEVKGLLANIGEEIERTGSLTKEYVDKLLRQLNNGTCDAQR